MDSDNGNGGEKQKIFKLILTFDPATFAMNVVGDVQNYDMGLAMLEIARRHFEGILRAESVRASLAKPIIANTMGGFRQ